LQMLNFKPLMEVGGLGTIMQLISHSAMSQKTPPAISKYRYQMLEAAMRLACRSQSRNHRPEMWESLERPITLISPKEQSCMRPEHDSLAFLLGSEGTGQNSFLQRYGELGDESGRSELWFRAHRGILRSYNSTVQQSGHAFKC
jgi:hypothetical protein